jgi:hypothetical protein
MGVNDNGNSTSGVRDADLNTGVPRRVRFDHTSITLLIGMLFILWVSIVGLTWMSYGKVSNAQLLSTLRQKGYAAEGEVTKRSANLDGVYVTYEFSVDGISYSGYARMKLRRYGVSTPGGQIPIRYLPDDPRKNLPINVEVFSVRDTQPFLLCLFFMGLSIFVIYRYLRERRLVRMGVVVEARVTGCAPYQKQFDVYYEFTTEGNESMDGSCITEDEYEVGASIPVIYRRSNPKKNESYPVAGFIIEDSEAARIPGQLSSPAE